MTRLRGRAKWVSVWKSRRRFAGGEGAARPAPEGDMDHTILEDSVSVSDPLDIVEQVLSLEGHAFERGDEEVHFAVPGSWSDVHGCFAYRDDLPTVTLTVGFDLRAPQTRRDAVCRLLALINENLWIGHFELWAEDGTIAFRHAVPLIDRDEPTPGEVTAMFAAAVDAANRFYPAFNFVIWAGKSPEEALAAAMFDTAGQA